MDIKKNLHSWDLKPEQAVALQRQLGPQVDTTTPLPSYRFVAAADVSYNRYSEDMYGAVVLFDAMTGRVVEEVGAMERAPMPYVPGLLSFREAPCLLAAFAKLEHTPDVVICDGQGIAHPRRLGIASHLGLWLDIPTVGCGKSLLCGTYEEPGSERGERSPLIHRGEVIGTVLRTRRGVAPVFVSPGHHATLASATELILDMARRFRLPEPIRRAHDLANEYRRAESVAPKAS